MLLKTGHLLSQSSELHTKIVSEFLCLWGTLRWSSYFSNILLFPSNFLAILYFESGIAQSKYVGFKKNLSYTQYTSVVKCIIDAFLDTFNCFIPLHFTPVLFLSHFCLLTLLSVTRSYYVALLPHTKYNQTHLSFPFIFNSSIQWQQYAMCE